MYKLPISRHRLFFQRPELFAIIWLLSLFISINACDDSTEPGLLLIDNDGNEFDTIKIGKQYWMQKNLESSHYRNGDPIPQVTSDSLWFKLTTGAWCWYNNDSTKYGSVYGKLYNWYAVNDPRGLAPKGWRVPGDDDWERLSDFLGYLDGARMKETSTIHWESPNTGATNDSGFTALPGGYRRLGFFSSIGRSAFWWSSTEDSELFASIRDLDHSSTSLNTHHYTKYYGFSVRCLRD